MGSIDVFEANFELPPATSAVMKMQFCACVNAAGTQHWDSNSGGNYILWAQPCVIAESRAVLRFSLQQPTRLIADWAVGTLTNRYHFDQAILPGGATLQVVPTNKPHLAIGERRRPLQLLTMQL